jgi:DNA polymerase IV
MAAWILHVDLDQFIAAVEVLRRPELRGKPVIVGGSGDPTQRAVVATASYEAREFGVNSGMPMRLAARKCPEAIFLPTDPPAYDAASAEVMATLREFDVVVEVLGWDEAFLGLETGGPEVTPEVASEVTPEVIATEIRQAVLDRTQLSCSIGIGDNKLRAKLATGFAKPAGIYRLTRENWFAVMGGRSTQALWGIGRKTASKLADLGFHTVRELAGADPEALAARFGPTMGPWYRTLALGAGGTEVTATPYVPRSRSRETTFQQDLTAPADVSAAVVTLARRVADDVVAEGRPAARVAVKVRFAPFFTHTRSITLPAPTSDADELERAALEVLALFTDDRPVRLLGVRAEF